MIEYSDILRDNIDLNYLFHFTKTSIAIENILYSGTLKFASIRKTNDPIEYKDLTYSVDLSNCNSKHEESVTIEKAIRLNEMRKHIKVCCFSIDDEVLPKNCDYPLIFNRGFCRSRMWSQYGENHYGVCLIFKRERLIDIISDSSQLIPISSKIYYENKNDDMYSSTSLQYNQIKGLTREEIFINNSKHYIFTKLKDYQDEHEYRIALVTENIDENDDLYIEYKDAIAGIILGDRFNDVYIVNVKRIANEKNIMLYKMKWTDGKPAIEIINKDT